MAYTQNNNQVSKSSFTGSCGKPKFIRFVTENAYNVISILFALFFF